MKVAIAGYGIEGEQNYHYFSTLGHEVTIVDEKHVPAQPLPDGARTMLGEDVFSKLDDFDMVVRTAGLAPRKIHTHGKMWSATNEFFEKCPAPIIGVTGTKGKGTTSSLITSILQAADTTVHLLGNIGKPALEELPKITADHIVVFELSSFQLWDIQRSPHVAVILGIEADHLDVHQDMDEYVEAKANITRYQSEDDILVYNGDNPITTKIAAASKAEKIRYPFDMSKFADALVIPGQHNVENAAAAIAATKQYVQDEAIIRSGLSSFTGLPHRIKFIREVNGVTFYDDSYSSAPTASIAALKSFEQPKIILLGGFEKGADFTELGRYIATTSSVRCAIVYGASRQRIVDSLREQGVEESRIHSLETQEFDAIVNEAVSIAQSGDVVLLSPGCASFDMFRNFTDRGETFTRIVENV